MSRRIITFAVALSALTLAAVRPAQAQGRFLGKEDILLYGLRLTVTPEQQDVPRDVATIVGTFLQSAEHPDAQVPPFAPDAEIRATLRGPSVPTPLELVTRPNTPFNIPALKIAGLHTLENIRLVSGGQVLMHAAPENVRITVLERLLVTQVTARPLTADEIREKGIVFDRSNFQAYNFAAAFAIGNNPIQINFPILLPSVQGADAPGQGGVTLPGIQPPPLPQLSTIIPDTLKLQTQMPNLSVVGFTLKIPKATVNNFYVPPIPGIVVIPGDIGFLNQYFSVMLMVGNAAPTGSNLVVTDLNAEIKLPLGRDGVAFTPDDPLAMANTVNGQASRTQQVKQPGPDGKLGTADDIPTIAGGQSGNAEYLVEGRREGSHIVEMNLSGTLLGLPGGPVQITGLAAGSVLVRNPKFTLTFTHPEVVTAGEAYTLDVTVTNTSESPANFVTVSLHPQHVGGADVLGQPSRTIDSIPPSDSTTVSFDLKAKVTGRVTAATLDADDNVSGRFALKTAVGELGVPLSPDSLVLPKEANGLTPQLRNAAIGLLGKAWAVATAPAAAVPRDLQRFSKKIVLDRAVEVAEAGLRVALHEPLPDSAAQLLFDFAGSNYNRLATLFPNADDREFEQSNFTGFDLLRRRSIRGDIFADAVAHELADDLAANGAFAFHRALAEKVSYRPGHISVLAQTASGVLPVAVQIVDAQGRVLGGVDATGKVTKEIPFSDYLTFGAESGGVTARLALIAAPETSQYTLRFVPIAGVSPSTVFRVSVIAPTAAGELRQLTFESLVASSVLDMPFTVADPYRLTMAGTPTSIPGTIALVDDPPPSVISVVQQKDADIITCELDDTTGPQVGRIVAVLFSEEVTRQSVQDRFKPEQITNFAPEGNAVVGVALQPGRRIAFLALRDPFGPLVERSITVSGVSDLRDHVMAPQTRPMEATLTDAGGRVSGRVLDAEGNAVAGANVRFFYKSPCNDLETEWIGISSKMTDGQGNFSWDFLNRALAIRIAAIEPGTNDFRDVRFVISGNGQHMTVNVVFLGRGTLQGRTLREDGRTPLEGAMVRVTSLTDRSQYSARTDAQGRFAIPRVPVGNVFIEAVHVASKSQFSVSELIPFAGATTTRDLVLLTEEQQPIELKKGALSGFVLESNGVTPVSGAPVVVYYQALSQPGVRCPGNPMPSECAVAVTNTDAQGEYAFESVVAGTLRLQTFDQDSLQQGEVGVVLPANGTVSANIVMVGGLATVRGKVVTAGGAGIAGAVVGGGLSLATTNDQGEFELRDVPVGRREIVAVSQAVGSKGSAVVDIVRAGETVNVTIVLNPVATVSGVVRRASGNPASGIKVYVLQRSGNETIQVFGQAVTNENGGYQIAQVPLGMYIVSAFLPDFTDGNVVPVTLAFHGETARADIRFRGGNGTVKGKVLGDNGTPLKARVSVSGDQVIVAGGMVGVGFERKENFRIVETSFTTGDFSASGIFVGPFTLRAAGQFSPDPIVVEQTMPSPGAEVNVNLQLQPTSRLHGVVFEPNGQTRVAANVSVRFQSDAFVTFCRENNYGEQECESIPQGVQEAFAVTDANGEYLFPVLNPGRFTVSVEDHNGWIGIAKGTVGAGQQGEVDIRLLNRADVTVEVLRSDLSPVNRARVTISRLDAPRRSIQRMTGIDGTVIFNGADALHEGEFIVEATDVDGGGAIGRGRGVITQDGEAVRVTVRLFSASGTVRGRLVKPDGLTPVPNAEAVVTANGLPMAFAVTDAQGQYSVSGLPLGPIKVDTFEAATARRAFGEGALGTNGGELILNLTQLSLGMVRGRAFHARTLEPLKNWKVMLTQQSSAGRSFPSLTATTEIDGSFSFPGTTVGGFTLHVSKTGTVGSGTAQGTIAREGQVIDVPVPVNIPRASFGTITGLVRAPGGAPAANARVEVFMRGAVEPTVITAAADGAFSFGPTEIGRYRIYARPQNGNEFGSVSGELTFDQEMRAVTIDLTGVSTITGTVFDGGQPLSGARVVLTGTPSSGCEGACTRFTNGSGQFTFESVPAEKVTIVAYTADNSRKGSVGDVLIPGQPKTVQIQLEPSRRLAARVLFANGEPAPGMVAEVAMGQRRFFAESGQNGVFQFEALPLATYSLLVRDPVGGGLATRDGILANDVTLDDIMLDEDSPSVVNVVPAPSATAVPRNQSITVRFSEPIDRATVIQANALLAGPTGPINGLLSVSDDDREVTFDPLEELAAETKYRFTLEKIEDRVGKVMPAALDISFTTVDVTAPSVLEFSPARNGNGISVHSVIRIKYSEALNTGAFTTPAIVVTTGGTGGAAVAGQIAYAFGNTVVIFTPSLPFNEDTTYHVALAGARDLAGNTLPATTYTFTTSDRTPPPAPGLQAVNASVIENGIAQVNAVMPATHDVQFVDFYLNDTLGFTARAPFTFRFKAIPALGAPGSQIKVAAVAADTSGNRSALSTALMIPVLPDAAPAVVIQQPAAGGTVRTGDLVQVRVRATDDLALAQVAFRARVGTWQLSNPGTITPCEAPETPLCSTEEIENFEFVVPSSAGPNATITLEATASDSKGTVATATPIQLTVLDTAGPTVSITGATTGTRVRPGQQTTVVVRAEDAGLVRALTFRATGAASYTQDRTINPAQGTVVSSFTFTVPPTAAAPEQVMLEATSTDQAGNVSTATAVLEVADVSSPAVQVATSTGSTTMVPGSTVLVDVTATDDIGVKRIELLGTGAFQFNDARTFAVARNEESARFTIQVPANLPVGALLNLQARAIDSSDNTSQAAVLTLTANTLAEIAFQGAPFVMRAGETRAVTFTLSSPAPAGGIQVAFASEQSSIATATQAVTVPAGQASGTVTLTAHAGGSVAILASIDQVERGRATVSVIGGIVSGLVFDPQSNLVTNASITVKSGSQTFPATTNDEGYYEVQGVPGPRVDVQAFANGLYGHASGTMAANGHIDLNVQLIDAAPVTGVVTMPNGTTRAGLDTQVSIYAGTSTTTPLQTVFTNDQGEYEFPLVEVGSYTIQASDAAGNRGRTTLTVTSGIPATAPVTFLGRGRVVGSVRDSQDQLVPGAVLNFTSTSIFGTVRIERPTVDGTFTFDDVFVGDFSVSASLAATGQAGSASGVIDRHDQEVPVTIGLSPVGTLEGMVYRGTTPVPNATVKVGARQTTTNQDGYYLLEFLPTGNYTVEATVDATYEVGSASGTLVAGERKTQNVTFLPQGSLVVTVLNASGQPVRDASVSVNSTLGGYSRRPASVETNASGVAVVEHLLAGTFTASVSANGLSASAAGTLTAGQSTAVTVRLEGLGSIFGTVFEAIGGQRASGGRVSISGYNYSAPVESNGTYRIDGVRLGNTYSLTVRDANNILRARASGVRLDTHGQEVEQNFTLVGLGTVSGRVVSGGQGVGNITVNVRSLNPDFGNSGSPRTDGAGFYTVSGIVLGSINVTAETTNLFGEANGTLSTHGQQLTIDVALVANTQTLPVNKYDANNTQFDIQRGINIGTQSSGFYNAFLLEIVSGGTATRFTGTTTTGTHEDGGREIVNRQQNLAGLNVTRKVYVPRAGYFGRWLEILSNPTDQPITVDVRITSGLGWTSTQRQIDVITTSSGDAQLDVTSAETADRWIVMDDSQDVDPVITSNVGATAVVFDGADAPARAGSATFTINPATNPRSTLEYEWRSVTVPAGQTMAFMHFGVRQITRASATASAQRLAQVPPEALGGLSTDELATIRNFVLPQNGQSALEPLPALTGVVTGRVLAGDNTTVVTSIGNVYFRSTSLFYPKRLTLSGSAVNTGTFTLTGTLAENGQSVAIPVGVDFTLNGTHPQTSVDAQAQGSFLPGQTTSATDLVFTGTSVVRGRVFRHTGAFATGGTVRLTMPGITRDVSINAQDGSYQFTGLPEGTFTLTATWRVTGFDLTGALTETSTAGNMLTRNITLVPTGSVTGLVTRPDGVRPSGFTVNINRGTFTTNVSTDTGGRYTFNNVPVGNWTVYVTEAGTQIRTSAEVVVVQDTATEQPLDMLPSRTVTAVVSQPGNVPAGSVPVRLIQAGFADKTGTTTSGQFNFTNVPGRTPFVVRASTSNAANAPYRDSAPVTITESGPAITVPVTLPAVATLRVTVKNGLDPAPNVRVSIRGVFETNFRSELTTNASGQVSFSTVGEGPVEIRVRTATSPQHVLGVGSATILPEHHGQTVDAEVAADLVLPRDLVDTNGFRFDVSATGELTHGSVSGFRRAYDHAARLFLTKDGVETIVTDADGIAQIEATGRELVTRRDNIEGLNITRKVYVPADGYFARYVEFVTNPSSAPVTVDLRVTTDPSSDLDTRIVDNVTAQWVVTDDDSGGASSTWPATDPTLAHIYGGPGATLPPVEHLPDGASSGIGYEWPGVTIEPGQTVAFMHFLVQQPKAENALASARRLVQLPPEAIADLSAEERVAIRNFAVPEDGSSPVAPLVIQPALTVTGQVFAGNGTTLVNANTTVTLKSGNPVLSRTASVNGNSFTLTAPVADSWVLEAVNRPDSPFGGWSTSSTPLAEAVVPEVTSVTRNITFTGTGSVSGVVRLGNGSPLTSGALSFSFSTGSTAMSLVQNGTFTLPVVPAGTHTATYVFNNFSRPNIVSTFEVVPGQPTSLVMEPPARASVEVTVLDVGGQQVSPNSGFNLSAVNNHWFFSDIGSDGVGSVNDVAEGPFSVYAFNQARTRFGEATGVVQRTDEGGTVRVSVRLRARADLALTVRRGDEPAENMAVQVRHAGTSGEFWWAESTNAAGQATVWGVDEGEYEVRVLGSGDIVLGSATGSVQVADDGTAKPVNIQLATDTVRISGMAFAADGETPAGMGGHDVEVTLFDVSDGSMLGRLWSYDGSFDFTTVPMPGSGSIRVRAERSGVIAEETVMLTGPEVTVNLTIPISVVKGRVVYADESSVPYPSVRIRWGGEEGGSNWAESFEDGTFRLVGVPAGPFTVTVVDEMTGASLYRSETMPGDAAVVVLNLAFNRVTGRVTFDDGEPVPNPSVFITQTLAGGEERTYHPSWTDEEGNFAIDGVQPGAFTVVASEFGLEGTVEHNLPEGVRTMTVHVSLDASGTLTGTFRVADGSQAIGGATIRLVLEGIERETVTDEATGRFEFEHVRLGNFAVYGQDPATGLVGRLAGTLDAEQPNRDVTLLLPATGTVTGQVVTGTPPVGTGPGEVIIENRDTDGPFGRFTTTAEVDAAGQFTVLGVPVGNVRVTAYIGTTGGEVSGVLNAETPLSVTVPIGSIMRLNNPARMASGGFVFDVTCDGRINRGGTTDGMWDAYNGAFYLWLDGYFPCVTGASLEESGRELVLDGGVVNGLTVKRKIFVPETNGFARYLEVLTNNDTAPRTVSVQVGGGIPRSWDRGTWYSPATTGNTFAVLSDRFGGGQGFAFAGPDAPIGASEAWVYGGWSYFYYTYDVVIPPGETRIVMHFAQQSWDAPSAHSATQQFMNLSRANMLSGMSAEERSQVVNFNLP